MMELRISVPRAVRTKLRRATTASRARVHRSTARTRRGLVGAIALLALTLTSLGVAADSPSTAGNRHSRAATAGTFAASAACSKATANQLVEQHRLNHFALPNPVRQVLCGAFTGPGSEAMAVTIGAPTCWGIQHWGVFTLTGGAWRLVLEQPAFLIPPLVAVGSDIRETTTVHRPGDPRCFPSGGKRSRIWHWNGTRLVAGPWKVTPAALRLDNFLSPDRKVWCGIYPPEHSDEVSCATRTNPAHSGVVKRNGEVTICNGCNVRVGDPGAPVLRYGERTELYGYRCTSARKGITCTVIAPGRGNGKGFLINRNGVRRVGP